MHHLKKKTRIALLLLAAVLFSALFAAYPVSASAAEKAVAEDYDALYVPGYKVKWDAFGTQNTHTTAQVFGEGVGTLGDGYLSVRDTKLTLL